MDPRIHEWLTDSVLEQACSAYGLKKQELRYIGGYQNFIYEYEQGSKPYILRLTPFSLRTPQQVEAELEWIRFLAGHGIPVSVPVPAVRGQWSTIVEGEPSGFIAASFEKAPGRRIPYPECLQDPQLIERCGRLTGRLHQLSREYRPTLRRHDWQHNDYLVNGARFIPTDQTLVHAAIEQTIQAISRLKRDERCYGLIHSDINVGNFMVDAGAGLTLFDFDECQYSWYVEDIAVQLYYMVYVFGDDVMEERMQQCAFFMEHFLRGYRQETDITDEWLRQIPLFLRLREMIVYAGMHRSYNMTKLDEWTSDYLAYSRSRIERGLSIIEGYF